MLAMETRIIVSGGGLVRVFSLPSGALQKCVPLAGAGALCCGGGQVFCACAGAVVRLDAGMLTPRALFAGGPGVCGLMHAARRLYALCGEGDGVLMFDSDSGMPMIFARAGAAPIQMSGGEDDESLVIAGGEGSCVTRLCPHTLSTLSCDEMPGPVLSAASFCGRRYALCLDEALHALLITVHPGGTRDALAFAGMPGAIAYDKEAGVLLAAVQGGLYAVSSDGRRVLGEESLPGCVCGMGSRLLRCGKYLLLLDAGTQRLMARIGGRWKMICGDAVDAAPLDT